MPAKATLTDLSVRALKAPARGQYTVWDKISPVGVRVSQGGSKTFILMIARGQRRTIGRVGIITLAQARTEAKRILAERTLGIGHKATNVTFDDALPQFVEENYRSKSPRSKHEANRLLRTHFFSALRTKKLSDITDQDVSTELGKLTQVPSEQLHAFRALRAMLRWCTRPPRRYLRYSPLEGYEAPGEDTKRSRALTDQELAKVWNACDGFFGDLIRLLILWGTRNGETGRLQRTWVEDSVLAIPGAFTKNGRAHAIPILPMAQEILAKQSNVSQYFFPGIGDLETHFKDGSWGKFKQELDERCGIADWQIRDIRRTFRTNMAKLKVRREIAELLLNHVTGANKNDLDEIYDRYDYLDEKREALAKWEARLTSLLSEKP